jgi:hypothetical protein
VAALGLIDNLRTLSDRLDLSILELPPPPVTVKNWPLVGEPLYQFWNLASTNLQAALGKIAPTETAGQPLVQSRRTPDGHHQVLYRYCRRGISLFAGAAARMPSEIFTHSCCGRGEIGERRRRSEPYRGVIGIPILQAFLAGWASRPSEFPVLA